MVGLMDGLSGADWAATSGCRGWTMLHLTAHMYLWDRLPWGLLWKVLTQQPAYNWMERHITLASLKGPEHLVEALKGREAPVLARLSETGRMMMYAEAVLHHEDLRRPLGVPRSSPPDPEALWGLVRTLGLRQLQALHSTGTVSLLDGHGKRLVFQLRPRERPDVLRNDGSGPGASVEGDPLEVALFLTGRSSCGVVVSGETPVAYELRTRTLPM